MSPAQQIDNKAGAVPAGRRHLVDGLFREAREPGGESGLIASECSDCGFVVFPRNAICPSCLSDKGMHECLIGRTGRIESYAITQIAPPGFTAPYIQAFIDLPEGPRVFSIITGCAPKEGSVWTGMPVEFAVEAVVREKDGGLLYSYVYRPAMRSEKGAPR